MDFFFLKTNLIIMSNTLQKINVSWLHGITFHTALDSVICLRDKKNHVYINKTEDRWVIQTIRLNIIQPQYTPMPSLQIESRVILITN